MEFFIVRVFNELPQPIINWKSSVVIQYLHIYDPVANECMYKGYDLI